MRLRRLDLTRYGKFTDRSIDFGERADGAPDLHIVYGPNEAGKSTAFAAFLDLLFGIEMQSRYGFLHPYSTMRIGACLELSAGARELVRIKRPQPTLRNAADEALPEALILGELGGLDRNAYRMMFSLDDDTLEAGGNAILASRGELGQLLFSASAGLSDLGRMLLDLKAGTDGFAKPGGRSGELAELKAELSTCKQAREAIDTLASEYNKLAAARELADAQYAAALAERGAAQAELARVRRLLAALPRMAAFDRLSEDLGRLPDVPQAPRGWLADLPGLQSEEIRHRLETERTQAEVKRLCEVLDGLAIDEHALKLSDRLDTVAALRVRHIGAEMDLPQRRRERATADGQVGAILARIGRAEEAEPARLLLTASQSSVLGDLIVRRSGVQSDVAAAAEELSRALHDLTEARRALHEEPNARAEASLAQVRAAMVALRDGDHTVRARNAARAGTQHEDALAARLLALAPWQGSPAALAAAYAPDAASAQTWVAAAQKAAALVEQRRAEAEVRQTALIQRAAEHEAIGKTAGLVSDREAAAIRGARETAWAAHRRALEQASAERFEAAMRRDDVVSAARLGHERDLAALREAARALELGGAEAARAQALLKAAEAQREEQAAMFGRTVAAIGLEPSADLAPAWLPGWLARRERALESWQALRQARSDLAEAQDDAARLRAGLSDALAQAGLPQDGAATLEALLLAAQNAIDSAARGAALGKAVTAAERDVRTREHAVQKAALADKSWHAAWRQACAACWLGEAAAALPVETVREMVAAAGDLAGALRTQADLARRIHDMEHDQAAFVREVAGLAQALGMPPDGAPPLDLAHALQERVDEAARRAQERQSVLAELARAEEAQRQTDAEARRHAARAGEMMALMGAGSLIELAGKLGVAAQTAQLRQQAVQTEEDILSALHAASLAEARAMLGTQAQSELEAREARLASELEDLEQRTRAVFAASKEAADRIAAVGGDDAAAMIEARRRTILLTIEEKARAYLRQRLGIAAAERALRAYRDQHRSAMMRQASDAFAIISRGAYRGLGTQPDRDGGAEVLIAIGADGASKLATDLSKGTRFQLYLALRAAGYQEFAKLRPPVPFIADDIMETFDDFRAEETLRVLGGMARLGQVIYLTHHDHLRAIAERTVPGVRVHRLVE